MLAFIALVVKYWKDAIIAVIFVLCGLVVADAIIVNTELTRARVIITQLQTEKVALTGQLDILADLEAKQTKKLDDAEDQRKMVMDDLSKKINSIRIQPIPKDCQGAVDYAVKNKGDLSWPK